MRNERNPARVSVRGFSLVELAVVMTIVAFLLGGLIFTLSAQVEQRNFEETRQRLEQARELLLGYVIVNGRLPCPARSDSAGIEVRVSDTDVVIANRGKCQNAAAVEDYYGGPLGGGVVGGFLPAVTIGFQPVDSQGYAVDAWGNRIRYAVAKTITGCGAAFLPAHFTNATNLKVNSITCIPNDLIVCSSTQVIALGVACAAGTAVTNVGTVTAIVLSTGKNGAQTPGVGSNEAENVDPDHVFVSRTPDSSGAAGGEFDDMLVWIPVGLLYGRLIAAGVLP